MRYIPTRPLDYSLTRTVAPTEPLLTLAEARLQLRVDTSGSPATNPEDALIEAAVRSATEELDAGTGWLARALAPQTWRLGLNKFPPFSDASRNQRIYLPYPPLVEVVSFTYVDEDGDTQTLVEGTGFRVFQKSAEGIAFVEPLYDQEWPTCRVDFDSVQITYQCGYGAGSPLVETVPDLIKNYVRSRITDLYDSRGVEAPGLTSKVPDNIVNSLEQFRVHRVYP